MTPKKQKTDHREPWDKQDMDTHKSFSAFCTYRNLGPTRSLKKAVLEFHKDELKESDPKYTVKTSSKLRQFQSWSAKHSWVSRTEAWDAEQDRLLELETAKKRKDMAKRHASQALLGQQKALENIKDIDPKDLTPSEALRFWTEAVRIERLSLGAPDHHTQHSGEIRQPTARWIDEIEEDDE